jgi:hypothetical protein
LLIEPTSGSAVGEIRKQAGSPAADAIKKPSLRRFFYGNMILGLEPERAQNFIVVVFLPPNVSDHTY